MCLIKVTKETRTILDFSKSNVSKNLVRKSLRQAEVVAQTRLHDSLICIENYIRVGMYDISLLLMPYPNKKRLKDYGRFAISIREAGKNHPISLSRDRRFKNQYWINPNRKTELLVKNLTDIIIHCNRLDKMKIFL